MDYKINVANTDPDRNRLKTNKKLARKVETLKLLEGLIPPLTTEQKWQKKKLIMDLEAGQRRIEQEFNDRLSELEIENLDKTIKWLREISGTKSVLEEED